MNYNRVQLMGRLTRDPEARSPNAPIGFGLATNRHYTNSQGEKVEEVTFVDVAFWGDKQKELIAKSFKKGDPIFIEGRLSMNEYEKDGVKITRLYVTGEKFEFLKPRS